MIGQKHLLESINSLNIDTFPHTMLLLGEKGIGKHTLINHIHDNILKMPIIDITKDICSELIDDIYRSSTLGIYVVDLSLLTLDKQNVLLKFAEEPLMNAFIILLAENKRYVLDTILNRCVVFEFEAYTREELASFLTVEENKDLILDILRSPGKILNTNINNMQEIVDICDKIATRLSQANLINTLSITSKINFDDEYDKFDFEIFLDALAFSLTSLYIKNDDIKLLMMYNILREERKKLADKRLNKKTFMDHLLLLLWSEARKDCLTF